MMMLLNILSRSSLGRASVIVRHLRPSCAAMSTSASTDEDVLFDNVDTKCLVTLNRPKALNALNLSMVRKITPKLKEWAADPKISMVIIKGAGDKAFCAGGDIKAVTELGKLGDPMAVSFFREEYILNNTIATLPIPYVALIDGITMGGGVGLSVHGLFRVATEKTLFAMPETAIGLFPDVGGGYFLPRLRGKLGLFLALTGYRLKGREVQLAGVATHFVESNRITELEDRLLALPSPSQSDIVQLLDRYQSESQLGADKPFSLESHMDNINRLFSGSSVEEILQALETDGSEWAIKQLEILKKMSPTSMKITHRQLTLGANMSLQEVLPMELRIAHGCVRGNDFYEGVRSVLVERDNNPQWNPNTVEGVTEDILDDHFRHLGDKELVL
ncbi:3-hydroxyisobutyryl-CoA hydrolase, mitochondrial-like [Patiria miniata]|uniref:3-hydroxyisobutyryl-CoA hydrolase, mitochondrial n=1 Tax=Patiria miniata TaxID=46514 RepID=A0A913Z523_PATMI|nr:3-hydroxyisobutyryl-CoA hydrolase, mitochondrial-like [Patiria miniata]